MPSQPAPVSPTHNRSTPVNPAGRATSNNQVAPGISNSQAGRDINSSRVALDISRNQRVLDISRSQDNRSHNQGNHSHNRNPVNHNRVNLHQAVSLEFLAFQASRGCPVAKPAGVEPGAAEADRQVAQ